MIDEREHSVANFGYVNTSRHPNDGHPVMELIVRGSADIVHAAAAKLFADVRARGRQYAQIERRGPADANTHWHTGDKEEMEAFAKLPEWPHDEHLWGGSTALAGTYELEYCHIEPTHHSIIVKKSAPTDSRGYAPPTVIGMTEFVFIK